MTTPGDPSAADNEYPARRSCCRDCKQDTIESGNYYMVHDEIWAASGLSDLEDMLCLDCLEGRLGRRLTIADFRLTDAGNRTRWDGSDCMVPRVWLLKSVRLGSTREADLTDERIQLVQSAKQRPCQCVGFLWRLRSGSDGWHCYRCARMPDVPASAQDIELLNAGRAPLPVLRETLGRTASPRSVTPDRR
jgi:hypothetical protein